MISAMQACKVLVAYYSLSGNTARVARDVAKALNADIESIRDPEHETGFWGSLKASRDAIRGRCTEIDGVDRNPAKYGITIVGTPVWAWHMTPAVRTYLRQTLGQPNEMAFFVTSGDTDASRIVPAMEAVAHRKAVAFAGFNARELKEPSLYNAKIASFVHSIAHAHRDARFRVAQAALRVSAAR